MPAVKVGFQAVIRSNFTNHLPIGPKTTHWRRAARFAAAKSCVRTSPLTAASEGRGWSHLKPDIGA